MSEWLAGGTYLHQDTQERLLQSHTFKSACIKNNKLIIIDSVGNSNDYPVKDIISIAKQLEGYVFESASDEAPEGAESDHLIQ